MWLSGADEGGHMATPNFPSPLPEMRDAALKMLPPPKKKMLPLLSWSCPSLGTANSCCCSDGTLPHSCLC